MRHLVRTFVGIRCGAAARRRLHGLGVEIAGADAAVKLPALEDLHITLQYLGDTAQEDITPIARALEEAVGPHAPLEVAYRGVGAFPGLERPRVLWAGIPDEEGGAALGALARDVGRALRPLGYRPEKRAFHPHVTLARVHRRPSEAVFAAARAAQAMDLGMEILSEVKLILSDPGHRPYHYIDLTTVDLEGAS